MSEANRKAQDAPGGPQWVPRPASADHALCDALVVGTVERFFDDGPCYAWAGDRRLGAFATDSAARAAVEAAIGGQAELDRLVGGVRLQILALAEGADRAQVIGILQDLVAAAEAPAQKPAQRERFDATMPLACPCCGLKITELRINGREV